jgi:thiamine-phosphate pyrophosphorylase
MALKRCKNKFSNKINNQKTNLIFSSSGCLVNKSNQEVVLRIIDANLNRCREGLRVVEDSLRFVLNDGILYKKIRDIRHNIDKILRDKYSELIEERDSIGDLGRQTPETTTKELSEIITANFKRIEESLRVLEEYAKVFVPDASVYFKKQRYETYRIEKKVCLKYKNF